VASHIGLSVARACDDKYEFIKNIENIEKMEENKICIVP
jgi:hypothetical protein